MTSELRVTALSNVTGDGPATLTNQTAAKALFCTNDTGTAFVAISGGINTSSLTDNGNANRTVSYTNNMDSRTYYCNFDDTGWGSDVYTRTAQVYHDFGTYGSAGAGTRTGSLTSSVQFFAYYEGSARSHYDYHSYGVVHGDLA
jgi:hypothetical protein